MGIFFKSAWTIIKSVLPTDPEKGENSRIRQVIAQEQDLLRNVLDELKRAEDIESNLVSSDSDVGNDYLHDVDDEDLKYLNKRAIHVKLEKEIEVLISLENHFDKAEEAWETLIQTTTKNDVVDLTEDEKQLIQIFFAKFNALKKQVDEAKKTLDELPNNPPKNAEEPSKLSLTDYIHELRDLFEAIKNSSDELFTTAKQFGTSFALLDIDTLNDAINVFKRKDNEAAYKIAERLLAYTDIKAFLDQHSIETKPFLARKEHCWTTVTELKNATDPIDNAEKIRMLQERRLKIQFAPEKIDNTHAAYDHISLVVEGKEVDTTVYHARLDNTQGNHRIVYAIQDEELRYLTVIPHTVQNNADYVRWKDGKTI